MATKPKLQKPSELECTAYHEAGHAVATFALHLSIREVSIIPDAERQTLGHCAAHGWPAWFRPDIEIDARSRQRVECAIQIYAVGRIAESRFRGRNNWRSANGDLMAIADFAGWACDADEEMIHFLKWLSARSATLLSQEYNWRAVERLAAKLMEKKRLNGREAKRVFVEAHRDVFVRAILDRVELPKFAVAVRT